MTRVVSAHREISADATTVFELIAESETDQVASWFFVLSHGYQTEVEGTPQTHGRVH